MKYAVANEELMLTQEELQATNEELETNNEELQATNEELQTTNDELTARTIELHHLMREKTDEQYHLSELLERSLITSSSLTRKTLRYLPSIPDTLYCLENEM